MRDYGKVHTSFWTSSNIRQLSEDARTLAMYLLTCPHGTIAGVFRLPDGYACEDLQWGSERVREGFHELSISGFATRCDVTKWVWIAKHFEWNPPENPNQRKAIAKVASQVPEECGWRASFIAECGEFFGVKTEPFGNPSETVSESGTVTVTVTETVGKPFLASASDANDTTTKPARRKAPTGTRLPDDWVLPKAWGEWALTERSDMNAEIVRNEALCFADYWRSKAGADARKVDWAATWRNWVRRSGNGGGASKALKPLPKTESFEKTDYGVGGAL